jgi:chemotaxis protein CheY-P-specific phosphatase CheC
MNSYGKMVQITTTKLMILFFSRFFHDIGELHAVAEAAATEDSTNGFIIIR